jgi:hypothetical protein
MGWHEPSATSPPGVRLQDYPPLLRETLLPAPDEETNNTFISCLALAARRTKVELLLAEATLFALMLHALAFEALRLERIYVSIIPTNRGSLLQFEKLGY